MRVRSVPLRLNPLAFSISKSQGMSLVELIIALGLVAALLAAAYNTFLSSTQETTRAVGNFRKSIDASKVIDQIERELQNIVPIRTDPSDLSSPTHSTVLGSLDPTDSFFIPWSLVPFPGYAKSDLNLRTDLSPIDPTSIDPSSLGEVDGLRFVYLPVDSQTISIALDTLGDPLPTNQLGDVNTAITIEHDSEVPPLNPGDFAVIADDERSDLIRITGIGNITSFTSPNTHWQIELQHSPSISIWNLPLRRDYGSGAGRLGYLHKVQVISYAFENTNGILYRDNHLEDDGFNPSSGSFYGGPSLAKFWSPFLQKVSKFQVGYLLRDQSETRAPAADEIGSAADPDTGFRGNELGDPQLLRVLLKLTYLSSGKLGGKELIERGVSVKNLGGAGGGGGSGSGDDLDGPFLTIGPPPPPPGPTPVPPAPSSTSTGSTTGREAGPPGGGGGGF